ncbi:hypothetical protein RDABS01_020202 [Bienertia sinuspersici]
MDEEELKAELEKSKEECRIKTEISESLRRAHTDQLSKLQEAKLQIEKQAKELNEKSEELTDLRQLYEEVKSKMHDMESSLKQISSMNEKIRIDAGEKVQKLEDDNRKLVSALEEETGKNDDLEGKLCACSKEIEGLKILLSESQKKCLEAEEKAQAGRELRNREEVISKLEEQSTSIQDQLKWKKEQFEHLEEAHKRLHDQFQSSKKEWSCEKSGMLEEISALQLKLDSQIRITENLESRLKMCNQALAHEESRRKALEVQLSESKQSFESVLAEYEEAKANIESLNTKRDEDIADLRNSFGMKEILLKEMEYRVTHLEQENKELLGSLKELREAQINRRKVDPSVNKLRNKLKDLEQVHSNCSLAMKEREVEWNSKMEKLLGDMKSYESDLKRQSEQLDQLKTQLDNCHSAMEVSDEETSIMLLVMKSELSDAYSKLFKSEDQVETFKKERGEMNTDSAQSLEVEGDCSPSSAQTCIKQAHEEISMMTQKLDTIKLLEERSISLESALVEHKKMLEESSASQLRSKEQVSQMEVALKILSNALEKSNSALATRISEATQIQIELQIWKSKAESFKTCLEQYQEVCKQMESSLLEEAETEKGLRKENESFRCKIKEQEQKIKDLEQKATSVDQNLIQKDAATEAMKLEVAEAYKKAEHYAKTLEERDAIVEKLQLEIQAVEKRSMERESAAAESARLEAENKFELEKQELCRTITAEKDGQIRCIREENESFKCKTKEQEQKIKDLEQKTASVDHQLLQKEADVEAMKLEVIEAYKKAEHYAKTIKERDAIVENLRIEIKAIESARLEAENKFELEKQELCRTITAEKDWQIRCIIEENESFKCKTKEQEQKIVENLRIEIKAIESARLEAENKFELEKQELCRTITAEKDWQIRCIREENESFKCKTKEQEQKIKDLEQKTASVDHQLLQKEADIVAMRLEVVEAYKKAEHYAKTVKERDAIVENLRIEIKAIEERSMERESAAAEAARLEAEINFEFEKEEQCRIVTAEKDGKIKSIQDFASSLEQDFVEVVLFSFSQGIEDMFKIAALQDALEKSEFSLNIEMERKNNTIDVLEKEVRDLQGSMLLQEESLLCSKQSVNELESLIELKKLDMEKLLNQYREEQTKSNKLMIDLQQEKEASVASIKRLTFERDNLLTYIEGICDQFGDFCAEDAKLEEMLGKMLLNSDKEDMLTEDVTSNNLSDLVHKNVKKEVEANVERSPLREIN